MRSSVLVFALLAVAAATAPLAADEQATYVVEPESKIRLPIEIAVLDGKSRQTLTGVTVREETIFKIDAYALGHYVDADKAATELAEWKDKTLDELVADNGFTTKLVSTGFERTLRLHLARDIDSDDFTDAFDEVLRARMKTLITGGVKGTTDDLSTFKGYFTRDVLAEGTTLDMTWTSAGKLATVMSGRKLGVIASPALCRAMWDAHFGDAAIQKNFRRDLVKRFPSVLEDQ